MRIVFMGTPDFAVTTLQALIASGHDVVAAVSQPDKPFGRKAELRPTPVKAAAGAAGIPVLQPRRLRDPEFTEELEHLAPDVIVVAAYGKIIPEFILKLPRYGCLNVHASLLPKYRGAAPIQWTIMDGEKETGVSIMQMNEGLDTGDILTVSKVEIGDTETGGSLFDKLAEEGGRLLVETLGLVEAGSLRPQRQPADSPTPYARMIVKEDGQIDWTKDAAYIERQVRAMDPWPGAYTRLEGKLFKILHSCVLEDELSDNGSDAAEESNMSISAKNRTDAAAESNMSISAENRKGAAAESNMSVSAEPGTVGTTNSAECDTIQETVPAAGYVLRTGKEGIDVCTGNGVLRVTEVQLEGKKRMNAADFLRGRPIEKGLQLG